MTELKERAINCANYILNNNATIRQTAKHFNMAKSTVHLDVSKRLQYFDFNLYIQIQPILLLNFNEKHIRGGEATKKLKLKQHNFNL